MRQVTHTSTLATAQQGRAKIKKQTLAWRKAKQDASAKNMESRIKFITRHHISDFNEIFRNRQSSEDI